MIKKETLLIDIENTEKEICAYELLSKGFDILSNLPENAGALNS